MIRDFGSYYSSSTRRYYIFYNDKSHIIVISYLDMAFLKRVLTNVSLISQLIHYVIQHFGFRNKFCRYWHFTYLKLTSIVLLIYLLVQIDFRDLPFYMTLVLCRMLNHITLYLHLSNTNKFRCYSLSPL